MPEYAWMCLYKQDSEYASGPKYAKILIMTGFSISECYTAFWPWQSSKYVLGSKCTRIQNMAGFGICKSYKGF